MKTKRRVVIDGREDKQGKSLLAISALYHCRSEFSGIEIRFVDVDNASVRGAIDLLRWETGLDVSIPSDVGENTGNSIFEGANLYAAIRLNSIDGLHTAEAAFFRVPLLLALQFLPESATSEHLALLRPAHDPALFAQYLIERIR
ncbi:MULTISPECIES: hypothetical protein [Methylobacteriaceae]|uniref:hypothetical protein n=1 Tax=Methylobacteriaceae TaxID=119045 RepID=UPI00074F9B60|nr:MULTISPECIES: hypothetical protein [Methylobacteriaceae]AMB47078.1 hypothetical protein Y590_19235 [Methylobacterium sp. AMS5]TFZ56812.1 hypothetical protein E4V01_17165 [Methylorubrum sp. Q1]